MGGSSDGEPRAGIEVGGPIHDRPRIEDHQREDDLAARGRPLVRVQDAEGRANLHDVLGTIRTHCEIANHPSPAVRWKGA